MGLLQKHTPRWIIFIIDVFICLGSITLAYNLRFNFSIPQTNVASLYFMVTFVGLVRVVSFIISKTYAGIIRYTGTKDAERIILVVFAGSLFVMLCNIISYFYITKAFLVPISILMIDFFTTVFMLTALRLFVKAAYLEITSQGKIVKNVVIYGVDQYSLITKHTLERESSEILKTVAFLDHSKTSSNKKLEGVNIYSFDDFDALIQKFKISYLIFTREIQSAALKNQMIEACLANDIKVLTVPHVNFWINGELSFNQIRKIRIEDLLGRDPIQLDFQSISHNITGQMVLVTGAAGSIGSELVRQLIPFKPQKIILFDQAESPLYDIEMELLERRNEIDSEVVIGDITNAERIENVFRTFKPAVVYHAAAYKHVPMMENNPSEAIRANVLGTKTIADFAVKYQVKTFVMISTDKAVNPTNIMGASKRIAEIYIQSLNRHSDTHFITTRFGNVLGSNGSVIPRFKKQIEGGGPITVTHPDITRYFMTIPEACQLVLEASVIGKGGEIFVFDMGAPVKIADLAKKMIQLSGLTLDRDIKIVYTGLRPGEKLYEELLNDKENTIPTHHNQIMIAKVVEYDFETISEHICKLIDLMVKQDNFAIARQMKLLVAEFISQNSVYEKIDEELSVSKSRKQQDIRAKLKE